VIGSTPRSGEKREEVTFVESYLLGSHAEVGDILKKAGRFIEGRLQWIPGMTKQSGQNQQTQK